MYFLTTTSGIYQQYINPFFLASLSALAASKLMWTLSDSKKDVNNFSRVLKLIAQVFWHEIICQSCHCCSTLFKGLYINLYQVAEELMWVGSVWHSDSSPDVIHLWSALKLITQVFLDIRSCHHLSIISP